MAMPNSSITGAFCVVAQITAIEGKGSELQPFLAAVRANSTNKAKEPDCLGYRTTRGGGDESDIFTVFETYANKEALAFHRTSEPYLALKSSGLIKGVNIGFFEEFE